MSAKLILKKFYFFKPKPKPKEKEGVTNKTRTLINMTTTISCDLKEQIIKHTRGIKCGEDALKDVSTGLKMNALALLACRDDPEQTAEFNRMKVLGEKRKADIENKIHFHKLMIMLFNSFRAVINGRSDKRVLKLVAEKIKEAIQELLAGIEELIPYGSEFYTEEEYRLISNALMKEYKAWSPLCDHFNDSIIVPVD